MAATFDVNGESVAYTVTAPNAQDVTGTVDISEGGDFTENITLQAAPTATVDFTYTVPAGGAEFPTGTQVCLSTETFWSQCVPMGPDIEFTDVPAGMPATWTVQFPQGSAYSDQRGSVDLVEGANTVEVPLTPRALADVRVYVATSDGSAIPAGTEVCVTAPDGTRECQPAAAPFNRFLLPDGCGTSVEVVLPEGSGYTAGTVWPACTQAGATTRVQVMLVPDSASSLTVNVSTEDGNPVPDSSTACVVSSLGVEECLWTAPGESAVTFPVGPGEYRWWVEPNGGSYAPVSGSVTVPAETDVKVDAVLPLIDPNQTSTVIVHATTTGGGPLPAGATICMNTLVGHLCQPVTDANPTATFGNLPPGSYTVFGRTDTYWPATFLPVLVEQGQTVETTYTFTPRDLAEITKTASATTVAPGGTITYTIQGAFTGRAVEITDVLPAGLTFVSATCAGTYQPFPTCYDYVDGILSFPGAPAPNSGGGEFTLTIVATVSAEEGTSITNVACQRIAPRQVPTFSGVTYAGIGSGVIIDGGRSAQIVGSAPLVCSEEVVTQVQVAPSPSPSPSPSPTSSATLAPSPTASATIAPTATVSPTATVEPSPTATTTVAPSPTATALPTGTNSPSAGPTVSATSASGQMPTAGSTASATTAAGTATPTPTSATVSGLPNTGNGPTQGTALMMVAGGLALMLVVAGTLRGERQRR